MLRPTLSAKINITQRIAGNFPIFAAAAINRNEAVEGGALHPYNNKSI